MAKRFLPLWQPSIDLTENMRKFLKERLIGQNEAIDNVCDLFTSNVFRDPGDQRPFVSVFLNGTSWVGKTMLFDLVGEFLNNYKEIGGDRIGKVAVTKIQCNSIFAFELVEMSAGLTNGAKNPGDSRRSKFEILFQRAYEQDPRYARQIIVLDEFDKLGSSQNWNEKNAFDTISQILDDAIPECKTPDSISVDWSNTIFVFTGNYFLNNINDPRKTIGFSVQDEEIEKKNEPEVENTIDKDVVIEKMRHHFSISAFQRVDKFIVFNDLSNRWDMRRDYAIREIEHLFTTIDIFYKSRRNIPPPRNEYGNIDNLVLDALGNSDPTWWFRAIKRYVRNFIKWRILARLHSEYPNPREIRQPPTIYHENIAVTRRLARSEPGRGSEIDLDNDDFWKDFFEEPDGSIVPLPKDYQPKDGTHPT